MNSLSSTWSLSINSRHLLIDHPRGSLALRHNRQERPDHSLPAFTEGEAAEV